MMERCREHRKHLFNNIIIHWNLSSTGSTISKERSLVYVSLFCARNFMLKIKYLQCYLTKEV